MSEENTPDPETIEAVEVPEVPDEEPEALDDLSKEEEWDEKVRGFVAQYRAKHPNVTLFSIKIDSEDEPRTFVAKLGGFKKMAQYAKMLQDEKTDFSEPMIDMVQRHIVFPKLSHDQLALGPDAVPGGVKSGHVVTLANKMQQASGFEDEAELKKL